VRELEGLRAKKLPLVAPRAPLGGLAFGKACLAQALPESVAFRDLTSGEAFAEAAIGAPRAIAVRPGGGLLALGAHGSARLEPAERSPHSLGAASFFPGSWLLPDLEDRMRFYVMYPSGQQIFRYDIGEAIAGMLPIAEQHTLAGYAGALTLTRDGAFVYATDHGEIARSAPRGSHTIFPRAAGQALPWRLLPAERLDEVWSVADDGQVELLELARGLPVPKRFRVDGQPFEVAANHDSLAFIVTSLVDSDAGARSWSLLVVDFDGHERFKIELPAPEIGTDDAWFEKLAHGKELALSAFAPLVAVGGSAAVQVFDYRTRTKVFAR
jgi:hypothetical protein